MAHPTIVINGITYTAVPSVQIPKSGSGTATFYDTSEADITSSDVIKNKKGYGPGGEVIGNIENNGDVSGTISTKAGTVSVPAGYTSGGTVKISDTEQAKIIPANIKAGVNILGQEGSLSTPTISQNSTTKVLSIS